MNRKPERRNEKLVDALATIAPEKGVTTSELAIAWAHARRADLVAVAGVRTLAQLEDSLAALRIQLMTEEMTRAEVAFPPDEIAGTRYLPALMKLLDSEGP